MATMAYIAVIAALFVLDRKSDTRGVSRAIFLPFSWMFLAGSRFVTQWLTLGVPINYSSEAYLEGSPLDRAVFIILILIGVVVLARRRLDWKALFSSNFLILLFFLFGAVSILWSAYPLVSLKRLIKTSGNVVMALIILTEERPDRALGVLFKRLGFILLPLSILFIKYYPDIGRQYHVTGVQMAVGVTTQKNQLGQLCLIIGTYLVWSLLIERPELGKRMKLRRLLVFVVMAPIVGWLFYSSNSATSLLCFSVAICIVMIGFLPGMTGRMRRFFSFGVAVVVLFLMLDPLLGLSRMIIVNVLKRDISLTTRVPMWYGLIRMAGNPIVGVGYESFWLGERLETVWRTFDVVHQAHNGYLETYLNLGFVGLSLILAILISGFVKAQRQLSSAYRYAMFKLVFLVVIVVYNWTEATFFGVNNMWLLMFVVVIDMHGQRSEHVATAKEAVPCLEQPAPGLTVNAYARKEQ